jgi:hypothetical protein
LASLVISESVEVGAPAARVWAVLMALPTWPAWNSVTADGALRVGGRLWIGVRLGERRVRLPARVSVLDAERELTWDGGVPGVLRAVHGFRVTPLTADRCVVEHHETFSGVAVAALPSLLGRTPGASHRRVAERLAAVAEAG